MAYASIASLLRTIELLLTSDSPTCDHREEFLSLREKVSHMEAFLRNSDKQIDDSAEVKDLEEHIKVIANGAEDIIELRLTDMIMAVDDMQKRRAHERFCESLQLVVFGIDHIQRDSRKVVDKVRQTSKRSLVQDSSLANHTLDVQDNMVGRENERERMLAELTREPSDELKVIPISGMGGIGKTTLAKECFNNPIIQSHFDVCAWDTISKQHIVKEILRSLLSSMIKIDEKKDEAELADLLKKSLNRKRYLVVMDDIWSHEVWDEMRLCFPECNRGSRILLTTRDSELARYVSSENFPWQMNFMDSNDSWNLFKSKAFVNEIFPSDLEAIGKQIAYKCQGLPLTIVVIAGLLSKSKGNAEEWENVAENIKSFITKDPDEQCLRVLALSYNYLPSYLKSCLLYLGIFPEDSEISVKRLVRLWIAEGFLNLKGDLEEEAKRCLKDLIDRCLVLPSQKSLDGRTIKTCRLHDIVRELCLREAQIDKFFVLDAHACDYTDDICSVPDTVPSECRRWITVHTEYHYRLQYFLDILVQPNTNQNFTRSMFLFGPLRSKICVKLNQFNLLRILDLSPSPFAGFPLEILSLIWLRYLALFSCGFDVQIPPEIYRLRNLQTFIIWRREYIFYPKQIWFLTQLRHLETGLFCLGDVFSGEKDLSFPNLQTVSGMVPWCCRVEIISRIKNIKKLGILGSVKDYEICEEPDFFDSLEYLDQLETLTFAVPMKSSKKVSPARIPIAKTFPAKLKTLKLVRTGLTWDYLNTISELPNLEVLKVKSDACCGQEWITEGVFAKLKLLLIDHTNLKYWKATNDNFPTLEHLVIRDCFDLEEIPIEFAEVDSLKLIDLKNCNPELVASAARIQEEQDNIGNKPVDVHSYNDPVRVYGFGW